jgi:hypothetical protein
MKADVLHFTLEVTLKALPEAHPLAMGSTVSATLSRRGAGGGGGSWASRGLATGGRGESGPRAG